VVVVVDVDGDGDVRRGRGRIALGDDHGGRQLRYALVTSESRPRHAHDHVNEWTARAKGTVDDRAFAREPVG
jgi:hypothetical protein